MAFVKRFYNGTTRRYIALFGTLFNKIEIDRRNNDGAQVQQVLVPIAYGPFQKFLSRITEDPNFFGDDDTTPRPAITLPRMSFEMTSFVYDGTRKISSNQKLRKLNKAESNDARFYNWSAAPYNIDFSLYIMVKYAEDGVKIIEQILPFFKPEWTTTARLIDDLDPLDIPLVLNGVTNEDLYEGSFEERRAILWTLNFTMKCWYFGPEQDKKVIKFVDADMFTDTAANTEASEQVNVYPGLTEGGDPSTDANNTIAYTDIEFDDDWGIIRVIDEE